MSEMEEHSTSESGTLSVHFSDSVGREEHPTHRTRPPPENVAGATVVSPLRFLFHVACSSEIFSSPTHEYILLCIT